MNQPDGGGPGLARRLVVATVIALVLGASTALAIRYLGSAGTPAARPSTAASPTSDPAYRPAVFDPSPSPAPSASPSPGPSTHRAPAPRTTTPTAGPSSARPSSSPSHTPMYQVPTKGLCRYVDFAPMASIDTSDPKYDKPEVLDGTKPGGTDPIQYTCLGGVGNVGIRLMFVQVYSDRVSADARWAQEKAFDAPTGMDPLTGLGDDAYGFYIDDPVAYKVVVAMSNVFVLVDLQKAEPPTAAKFKQVVADTAGSILAKLPAS